MKMDDQKVIYGVAILATFVVIIAGYFVIGSSSNDSSSGSSSRYIHKIVLHNYILTFCVLLLNQDELID